MSTKIVVVSAGQLPPGVGFPPLEVPEYGWENPPGLDARGIAQAIDHYVACGETDRTDV